METASYQEFGEHLLSTYDLDPLYAILAQADWPESYLKRFLIGYWIFYSAGVAAHLAEFQGKAFYEECFIGDRDHWPRGHERRHMRGSAFVRTVGELSHFASPEHVVDAMTRGRCFQDIAKHVQTFSGFGPWISWKIADMTERVLCRDVDFADCNLFMYRDPVKGAALLKFGDQHHPITADEVGEVVEMVLADFHGYLAPPYQDRPLNVQEVETILCKYKSHINGHYPLGTDTKDITEGLEGWGEHAEQLKELLAPYYQLIFNN